MPDSSVDTRLPVWLPILVVVIGGAFYIAGKNIEVENNPADRGTISVSGDGRAFITPDIAEISVGMQTGRVQTAAAAMERLKTAMDAVIAAVEEKGIEEKDIRSEYFSLNPVYDYTTSGQVPRGFEASQSLRIKVRDLDKVSEVLGAATAAGANQSGGVSFTVDNPEAKRAEARAEAIAEAKQKAQQLAQQLGVELGGIINFSEGYGGGPVPPVYYSREAYGVGGADLAQEKAAIQLPAGEQEVNVSVTITYELED